MPDRLTLAGRTSESITRVSEVQEIVARKSKASDSIRKLSAVSLLLSHVGQVGFSPNPQPPIVEGSFQIEEI